LTSSATRTRGARRGSVCPSRITSPRSPRARDSSASSSPTSTHGPRLRCWSRAARYPPSQSSSCSHGTTLLHLLGLLSKAFRRATGKAARADGPAGKWHALLWTDLGEAGDPAARHPSPMPGCFADHDVPAPSLRARRLRSRLPGAACHHNSFRLEGTADLASTNCTRAGRAQPEYYQGTEKVVEAVADELPLVSLLSPEQAKALPRPRRAPSRARAAAALPRLPGRRRVGRRGAPTGRRRCKRLRRARRTVHGSQPRGAWQRVKLHGHPRITFVGYQPTSVFNALLSQARRASAPPRHFRD
jgi:hypothetical protein